MSKLSGPDPQPGSKPVPGRPLEEAEVVAQLPQLQALRKHPLEGRPEMTLRRNAAEARSINRPLWSLV